MFDSRTEHKDLVEREAMNQYASNCKFDCFKRWVNFNFQLLYPIIRAMFDNEIFYFRRGFILFYSFQMAIFTPQCVLMHKVRFRIPIRFLARGGLTGRLPILRRIKDLLIFLHQVIHV